MTVRDIEARLRGGCKMEGSGAHRSAEASGFGPRSEPRRDSPKTNAAIYALPNRASAKTGIQQVPKKTRSSFQPICLRTETGAAVFSHGDFAHSEGAGGQV